MSAATDVLKAELKVAEASLAAIKVEEKDAIDAGKRAERKVTEASWRVEELKRGIITLEAGMRVEAVSE